MDVIQFPGLGPLLDPLALAIVGGGTVAAVVLRTPMRDLGRGLSALRVLGRRPFDAEPLVAQIAALERIAKRHGVLTLDRSVIADPDVAAAVEAVVDGAGPDTVRELLEHRFAARLDRHRAGWEVWTGAAEAAPAMGMIGTLIGLVQMFVAMRDPAAIGGAMAVALLTTLYGAALANLFFAPIAARLKRHARAEATARARIVAPLVALAAVEPAMPRQIREHAA
jgi:chemotaxis protein MotA